MAYGLAGARREELKDKQRLSLRTELRSYRLNGSGINKIVRSASATPWCIKRSNVHVQTCNRCSDSARCRLVVDQPVAAQAAISEPDAYAFYHPGADRQRGSSQPTSRIGSSASMTEYLVAARAAIILWTSLAVMPAEIVFDAIEAELERRGVEP